MTHRVLGELVTAGTADFPTDNDRQKWYKLVPYGEKSAVMASGHQFSVDGPGRIKLPADPRTAHINEEHDRKRPIGCFDKFKDTAAALYGRVVYAPTTAGNDGLVLASEGLRTGISVELESPVIRAGSLLAGELSNAGAVVSPSFENATVLAAAADVGEVTAELEAIAQAVLDAAKKLQDDDAGESGGDDNEEKPPMPPEATATAGTATASAASVAALAAMLGGQAQAPAAPAEDPLRVLAAAQANLSSIAPATVRAAAMDQITQGDVYDVATVPEYVGELWKGRKYAGRYLDLLASAPLVSQSVIGWRWIAGKTPTVAKWATPSSGSPATMNDIPTSEVKAEQKTYNGFRIAGGNAVDRIHADLPNQTWWESYNGESTDDYARKLDAEVIAHITTAANMTNLNLSTTADTEDRLLEGIGMATDFADPDWILVGFDIFKALAKTKQFDLSRPQGDTITLSAGQLRATYLGIPVISAPRSLTAQNGRVIVGCKNANVLHSLPGGPIRVDAQAIQQGKIEHGVFGYHILRPTDPRGVIDVTKTAA